jgi:hypothetical protein
MGTDKTGYFGPGSVYHSTRADGRSATLHELVEADRSIDRDLRHGLAQENQLWQLAARLDALGVQLALQAKAEQARWAVVDDGFTLVASALNTLGRSIYDLKMRQDHYRSRIDQKMRDLDNAKHKLESLDPNAPDHDKDVRVNLQLLLHFVKEHFGYLHTSVDMAGEATRELGHGLDAASALASQAATQCLALQSTLHTIDSTLPVPPPLQPPPQPQPRPPAPPDPVRVHARSELDQFNHGGFPITGGREERIEERAAEATLLQHELADEVDTIDDDDADLDQRRLDKAWRERAQRSRGGAVDVEAVDDTGAGHTTRKPRS